MKVHVKLLSDSVLQCVLSLAGSNFCTATRNEHLWKKQQKGMVTIFWPPFLLLVTYDYDFFPTQEQLNSVSRRGWSATSFCAMSFSINEQ